MIFTFWSSAFLVAHCFLIYPAIVLLAVRLTRGRARPPAPDESDLPSVSVLIAAHNEETFLRSRIEAALATDYPPEKFEIVIASDGSADGTAEIARGYSGRGVRLLDFKERRGKTSILNEAVRVLRGDIILFSDANTFPAPGALRSLVRWFADPAVGVVCGRLLLIDNEAGSNVDGLYWKFENVIKSCEGRLGCLLGANGAIYAMRKSFFRPVPRETIIDDFVIPLKAVLDFGCAIVYDQEATAFEETPRDLAIEFGRRCRIGAGGFQSLTVLWRLLDPRRGWVAFAFFSHKVLRWLCPLFLLLLYGTSALLLSRPFYLWAFLLQTAFYATGLAVLLMPGSVKVPRFLRMGCLFAVINASLFVGFWRWLLGLQKGTWQRTARTPEGFT